MKTETHGAVRAALVCLFVTALIAGCKNDAVNQAEKADKINGVAVPSIEETKQIAKEGFVYGLPLVMYYTSAYELFVDPSSGQFKAPVGKLANEARVFTYKDTAVITPNSDTPYSLMEVDLRLRLYWPKETPPLILPAGKGTWQPPGVIAAS